MRLRNSFNSLFMYSRMRGGRITVLSFDLWGMTRRHVPRDRGSPNAFRAAYLDIDHIYLILQPPSRLNRHNQIKRPSGVELVIVSH